MNAEELEKFKQLLAAYDQALRLQRMRERTIETYRQYLWKAAKHFNRCPDNLSAVTFRKGVTPWPPFRRLG
jgi:hypothetical protein